MTFSAEQKTLLDAPLNRAHVKTREQAGRDLSYVESWHVIAECNRIFGFDAWSFETIETHCVVERERTIGKKLEPGWAVTYTAKVKLTVAGVVREDVGAGHGVDRDIGQAHESAIKEAVSDAQKRALRSFGNQFGLPLYDKEQRDVADDGEIKREREEQQVREDFIRGAREHIEQSNDWAKLHAWWMSPQQKEGRSKYCSNAEREELLLLLQERKLAVKPAATEEPQEGT